MNAPLVSIIIPCRDAAPFLAAAIGSALAQHNIAPDVIVVDDGSRDDSAAIARSFADRSVRLETFSTSRGAAAARNAGLRLARGAWIQFLDADDLLAPDKIAAQLTALRGSPERAIASGAWARFTTRPDAPADVAGAAFVAEPVWSDPLAPVDWLVSSWSGGGMMHPAAWLAPRAVIEAAGPWNEALSLDDDGEFFTRVVLASSTVRFVAEARSFYRTHAGPRLSARNDGAAASSSFLSTSLKSTRLLGAEDSPRTRRAIACNYRRFAWEQTGVADELVDEAVACWRRFDASLTPPPGGRLYTGLSRVLGWRRARRLERLLSTLRPR